MSLLVEYVCNVLSIVLVRRIYVLKTQSLTSRCLPSAKDKCSLMFRMLFHIWLFFQQKTLYCYSFPSLAGVATFHFSTYYSTHDDFRQHSLGWLHHVGWVIPVKLKHLYYCCCCCTVVVAATKFKNTYIVMQYKSWLWFKVNPMVNLILRLISRQQKTRPSSATE